MMSRMKSRPASRTAVSIGIPCSIAAAQGRGMSVFGKSGVKGQGRKQKPLTHIPGMAERIAARLRPDGKPVRFGADGNGFHVAARDIDRVDDFVIAARQPEIFSISADISHVGAAAAGNGYIAFDFAGGKVDDRYAALAVRLDIVHMAAAIGDIELPSI